MDRWYFTYSKLYVYIVEEKLAEALTSFKIMEEGEFIRRTHTRCFGTLYTVCPVCEFESV